MRILKAVYISLGQIFKQPFYAVLAILVAVAVLFIIIWLPNHELLRWVLLAETFSLGDKVKIFWTSFAAWQTIFSPASRIVYLVIAILAGVNLAQLTYYFRQKARLQRAAGISIFGIIGSFLGVGCPVCGSVVLSSMFGLSITATVVGILPLKGLEFGLLSILLLAGSISYVAYKTQQPLACRLPNYKNK